MTSYKKPRVINPDSVGLSWALCKLSDKSNQCSELLCRECIYDPESNRITEAEVLDDLLEIVTNTILKRSCYGDA